MYVYSGTEELKREKKERERRGANFEREKRVLGLDVFLYTLQKEGRSRNKNKTTNNKQQEK